MVFVFLMILWVPSPTTTISLNDKVAVSGIFIASCFVGITLALYPGWIRRVTGKEPRTVHRIQGRPTRLFSGHHPDCERFQTHRIIVDKKTWCAGCLGLLIGSLLSILLMALYTISSTGLSRFTYGMLLLLGLVLVVVIFLETIIRSTRASTHLFFNGMFIPSFFFITMSVTELTGKSLFGMFSVLLCALWLDTRVTLSTWRHRSTCSRCTEPCKMYARTASSVSKSRESQR
jgi:hypothetical protein